MNQLAAAVSRPRCDQTRAWAALEQAVIGVQRTECYADSVGGQQQSQQRKQVFHAPVSLQRLANRLFAGLDVRIP